MAGADLTVTQGRPLTREREERTSFIGPGGVMAMAGRRRRPRQHGTTQRGWRSGSTDNSREPGRAVWGGGEVRTTEEAGELRRREGTSVKDGRQKQRRTWGLTTSLAAPGVCSEVPDGVTRFLD